MQINELKRNTKPEKSRYIGRGGKRGTTSGRGTKGQNARAGHKKRPEFRDIIKKLPKLRGYKFNSFAEKTVPINLSLLDKSFVDASEITPAILVEKGLTSKKKGVLPRIKILATGTITKKLTISGCEVSASAKEKIEKVGGSVQ